MPVQGGRTGATITARSAYSWLSFQVRYQARGLAPPRGGGFGPGPWCFPWPWFHSGKTTWEPVLIGLGGDSARALGPWPWGQERGFLGAGRFFFLGGGGALGDFGRQRFGPGGLGGPPGLPLAGSSEFEPSAPRIILFPAWAPIETFFSQPKGPRLAPVSGQGVGTI